jgi:hypothetical protein
MKNDETQKKIRELELEKIKEKKELLILEKEVEMIKYNNNNNLYHKINNQINHEQMNNQLINFIVDQAKIIENLKPKNNIIEEIKDKQIISCIKESPTLNLNNVFIVSRLEDNFINATQLCHAGQINFNTWYSLDTTKELINIAANDVGIPASQLVDIKKDNNDLWIHPDLAIQLAQWISPFFGLQVSKWIRTIFTNNIPVDVKILEEQEKEIQLKNKRIQILEDTFVKKQKRKNYPDNVIYIVTTPENKKNRIYIIGKASSFKNRLSTYNKTAEHEVIYYKQCKSEESLKTIENHVLNKLSKFREKANRDRFILPANMTIKFFTDVIDECVTFVDDREITI